MTLSLAGVYWLGRLLSPKDLYQFRPSKGSALLDLIHFAQKTAVEIRVDYYN